MDAFRPNPKLKLREQLGEVMRFKNYSLRTEEMYWHWIRRYILFHQKKHPKEMGAGEARAFLTHLAAEKQRGEESGDHVATKTKSAVATAFVPGSLAPSGA